MKKNLLLLATLVFAAISFTACTTDEGDSDTVLPTPSFKTEAIRLLFKSPVRYDNNYNLTEMELTESGNYLFRLNKGVSGAKVTRAGDLGYMYLVNTFIRTGELTYQLNGFGTVTIKKDGNKYLVTLTFGGQTITVEATEVIRNIINSQMTLNLCRKWTVVSTRVQIEGVSAFYQEDDCNINSILNYVKQHAIVEDEVGTNQVVTNIEFTGNGTFSIYYANNDIDKGDWQWVSADKGTLKYTWEYPDMGYSFINGQATVVIKPAGTASQLKLAGTVKTKDGSTKPITTTVNIK